MSIEILREELKQIIETADYDTLLAMREAVLEKEIIPDPDSDRWWEELPQHVREGIERGIKQSRAGLEFLMRYLLSNI